MMVILSNAVVDACYKAAQTKQWEPIEVKDWRGADGSEKGKTPELKDYDADHYLIKEELMPSGATKWILKNKKTGAISQIVQ